MSRRIVRGLSAVLDLSGVSYADGRGGATVPKVGLRGGPWKGFRVSGSIELVVGVGGAAGEPLREIGGLEVAYEQ
jgi:hypothetical protein